MSFTLMNGGFIASIIKEDIKTEVNELKNKGINPYLAVIIVGDDKASEKYVSLKEKTCLELGIKNVIFRLSEETEEDEISKLIDELNLHPSINGILIQMPLPKRLDQNNILQKINPIKDVDGFTPYCLGRLLIGDPLFIPCTPKGIIRMLDAYEIQIERKNAVIIGRSIIVGKPLSLLLLRRNATVTVCHSKTEGLAEITKRADILCVAVGNPNLITADMVKDGAVIIDVGINVTNYGKVIGDVDFDSVKEKASYITPVPGGVGPMTIAMLMENTVYATKLQKGLI